MGNIFTSKSFWISAILIVAVVFIAGLNVNKNYRGETDILFLPKNDSTTRNIRQILENAKTIPGSFSFYTKMLELNADIEDEFAGLPDNKVKSGWQDKIEVTEIGKSGVIRVNIFDKDQFQAEIISRQTAGDIVAVLGRYYSQAELEMRIIDGPIIYASSFSNKIYRLVLISLLSGFLIGSAISLLVKVFSQSEMDFNLESLGKYFKPKNNEEEDPLFSKYFSINRQENHTEKTEFGMPKIESLEEEYHLEKRAEAPSNLPIAEEIILEHDKIAEETQASSSPEQMEQTEVFPIKEIPEIKVMREATAEEVKARLNKLLNG
jgi:capsular polysaccharide biosynthesis protein